MTGNTDIYQVITWRMVGEGVRGVQSYNGNGFIMARRNGGTLGHPSLNTKKVESMIMKYACNHHVYKTIQA